MECVEDCFLMPTQSAAEEVQRRMVAMAALLQVPVELLHSGWEAL